MKIKQSEKGLYEVGFDGELTADQLEEMLSLFPSSDAVTELLFKLRERESFTDMKRGELYPEVIGSGTRLRRIIAQIYEIEEIQAQPNFSCNGCIDTFLSYIQRLESINPRRNGFMVATPTYFRYYHKIEALRLKLLGIPLQDDYEYPIDDVLRTLKSESPSCFFIVTPNNPTGMPVRDQHLVEILDNVPDDLNVAIDRTCVNIDSELSTKSLLTRYSSKRLAIFHSFSKYYGMSHLRIGFSVFSNKDLAAEVDRYTPFGLNLEAVLKATYILMTNGELKPSPKILDNIRQNKFIMNEFLARNPGFRCSDFKSNYAVLTLPLSISSRDLHQKLQAYGISIMPGHELPVPDETTARIHTGGPPESMRKMVDVIQSLTFHTSSL